MEKHFVCAPPFFFLNTPKETWSRALGRADRKKTPLGTIYRRFHAARRHYLPYKAPALSETMSGELRARLLRSSRWTGYTDNSPVEVTSS